MILKLATIQAGLSLARPGDSQTLTYTHPPCIARNDVPLIAERAGAGTGAGDEHADEARVIRSSPLVRD
jgi:hypothetical protein